MRPVPTAAVGMAPGGGEADVTGVGDMLFGRAVASTSVGSVAAGGVCARIGATHDGLVEANVTERALSLVLFDFASRDSAVAPGETGGVGGGEGGGMPPGSGLSLLSRVLCRRTLPRADSATS